VPPLMLSSTTGTSSIFSCLAFLLFESTCIIFHCTNAHRTGLKICFSGNPSLTSACTHFPSAPCSHNILYSFFFMFTHITLNFNVLLFSS
jgi:hypothetical protein